MDFDFSDDQNAFRDAVRSALEGRAGKDYVRAMMEADAGVTDEFWSMAAELGWTGLLVPEAHGGLGLGLVDAVVLMEETGRAALPGPLFSSAILATTAAVRLGADDVLADLASGTKRGTVAITESSATDPLAGILTRAEPADGGWRLSGTKSVVLDGHTADWVIVAATLPDGGLGAFLVEDPSAELVPSMDPTRKIARLVLEATPARQLGDGDVSVILQRIIDDASVGLAAEMVGGMEQSLDLAVEYSNTREQFGRPIGVFQAIRHMAAEMLQKVVLARVGTHYAAWTSDENTTDRVQSVALAKSWAAEAAIDVTGQTIQIHGAVGFTWDSDPHLFYKRAKVNDLLLGPQGWQRTRVADEVIANIPVPA